MLDTSIEKTKGYISLSETTNTYALQAATFSRKNHSHQIQTALQLIQSFQYNLFYLLLPGTEGTKTRTILVNGTYF